VTTGEHVPPDPVLPVLTVLRALPRTVTGSGVFVVVADLAVAVESEVVRRGFIGTCGIVEICEITLDTPRGGRCL